MGLVAAVAVCFRWPGLSVPVGLASLYAFAVRRDAFARPTRQAFGQLALALYLPPALGILTTPTWWWDTYTGYVSMMPTYLPPALLLDLTRSGWSSPFSPQRPIGMVLFSLFPLLAIAGLLPVARRGKAWRIACILAAAGMSALSTLLMLLLFSIPT
jgi:hypothetical protein